ncbi:MAG TPA: putative Ig domain-containing protein, partial [Verrucomicrobiae bacterium]|nr:putative Ig domain-containing protein [Verrucomicrobiae bacterium]
TIEIVPPAAGNSVDVGSTQALTFTALVGGDSKNAGVSWTLTGSGCSGTGCGTLSNSTPQAVTYTAPASLPSTTALSVTLTATSVTEKSVTQTATINVEPAPTFLTTECNPTGVLPCVLPNGENGVGYSTTISFTGGVAPYRFNMPALPACLQLVTSTSGTTAAISGRPCGSGSTTFTVTLMDSGGAAAVSQQFTITISPPPGLSITTTSLPPSTVDATYASAVATQGGVAPLAWSVISGALPPGVVLNPANGKITGIPTTAGTFSFTVQVKDSALPTSQTATQAFSVTIATPAPLSITTSSLAAGVTATGYSGTLQATGGVLPYTWSLTNGQLPAGLKINSSGTITGTPVVAGTSTFTVQVADSEVDPATGNPNPMIATKQFTITVTAGTNNDKLFFNGYSFLFTGFDKDGSMAIAGFLTTDGQGNITSGGEDITRVSKVVTGATLTGTYSIDSNGDGHGTMEIVATLGQNTLVTDYRLVLDSSGNVKFFEDKPATANGDTLQTHGEGVMKPIVGSTFSAVNLSGNYAFEFAGQDLSQKRAAFGGVLNADGNATFSSGLSDFNDAGTFSSGSVSGSFSFIAGNRGTASLTFPLPSGQATLNFVYYFVSPSDLYLVEVDSSQGNGTPTEFRLAGEMILQQPTTAFTSSILQGVSVASGSGVSGANANADVFAGLLTATVCNGSTAVTLAYDENNGGAIAAPSFSGTCTVNPKGRASFSGLGATAADERVAVAYLTGPGQGFILGSDSAVTTGLLEQQSGGPTFANSSVLDGYTLSAPFTAETQVKNIVGEVTADGAGNISGTVDEIDPPATGTPNLAQALSGALSIQGSGRGTLTPAGPVPSGLPASAIFYLVSPAKIRVVSNDPTDQHPELIFLDH